MHQRDPSAGSIDGEPTSVLSSQYNQWSSLPGSTVQEPSHVLGVTGEARGSKRLLPGLGETQAEAATRGRDPGTGRQGECPLSKPSL